MARWTILLPVAALSLTFFVLAARQANAQAAFFMATLGALVPMVAMAATSMANMMRWRDVAKQLGLVIVGGGAYPDMRGRYAGRKLLISRRSNPYGGARVTLVRLGGFPDLRLPGTLRSAKAVRTLIDPLLQVGAAEDEAT